MTPRLRLRALLLSATAALTLGLAASSARAESAEHLARCVHEALGADRPTLIEVRQDSRWLS